MRENVPVAYAMRPNSSNCGGARGGCSGCCATPALFSRCVRMRLITAGSSIAAITFIDPPQVAQVSNSARTSVTRPGREARIAERSDYDRQLIDGGDDLQAGATIRTVFDVDIENLL